MEKADFRWHYKDAVKMVYKGETNSEYVNGKVYVGIPYSIGEIEHGISIRDDIDPNTISSLIPYLSFGEIKKAD